MNKLKEPKPKNGYIYCIWSEYMMFKKLGMTHNDLSFLQKRYKTNYPCMSLIMYPVEDRRKEEKELFEHFRERRIKPGEHFNISLDEMENYAKTKGWRECIRVLYIESRESVEFEEIGLDDSNLTQSLDPNPSSGNKKKGWIKKLFGYLRNK